MHVAGDVSSPARRAHAAARDRGAVRAADAPVEMPDDFDVQCNDNSDDVTEWCDDASDGPTLPPTECKCPRMRSRLPLCGRVAALLLRQSPRSSRRGRL